MNENLEAALSYAQRGYAVLPIHTPTVDASTTRCSCRKPECSDVGKHPRTMNGLTDATTDEAKIRRWWEMWPDANVGVRTGKIAEGRYLFVLDVDSYAGGDDSLDELQRRYGALPDTMLVLTGGGGKHFYFESTSPLKTTSKQLGPGLDTRGGDERGQGYLVAPPSLHQSGKTYTLELSSPETPAAAPAWLAALLTAKSTTATANTDTTAERLPDGTRKKALDSLGSSMWAKGASEDAIVAAIIADDSARCDPPLGEKEARRIAKFVMSKPRRGFEEDGDDVEFTPEQAREVLKGAKKENLYTRKIMRAVLAVRRERDAFAAAPKVVTSPSGEMLPNTEAKAKLEETLGALQAVEDLTGAFRGAWERKVALSRFPSGRTLAEVTTREHETADTIEQALGANALAMQLYQRVGMFVQIRTYGIAQSADVKRAADAPVISRVERAAFRDLCSRSVLFYNINKVKGSEEYFAKDVRPDTSPINAVYERGQWDGIPLLRGLSNVPILRADGSIHNTDGYDAQTGIVFVSGGTVFPEVPASPTLDDAKAALEELREPFAEFPFEAKHHEAGHLAAILTAVGRHAFEGPSPLPLYDATTPGSGKTKLAELVGWIALGSAPALITWPENDDAEVEKRIVSCLDAGDRVVLFDNLKGQLGGGALEALITAGEYAGRILGRTEKRKYPNLTLWVASGNNTDMTSDMTRRTVVIRLAPKIENPEDRAADSFRIPNLSEHIREHRPRLVVAALTVLRAYIAAGKPAQKAASWGSHPGWERLISHALVWAGAADPGAGRAELRRVSDGQREDLEALIRGWKELCEGTKKISVGLTVKEALAELERNRVAAAAFAPQGPREALRYGDLREALSNLVPGVFEGKGSPTKRISALLKKHRGRIVRGIAIEEAGKDGHSETVRWSVATASNAGFAGSAGFPPAPTQEKSTYGNDDTSNPVWTGAVGKPVTTGKPAGCAVVSAKPRVATPFDAFLKTCWVKDAQGYVPLSFLADAWVEYAAEQSLDARSDEWFESELEARGLRIDGAHVLGLSFRPEMLTAEGSAA